MKVTPWLSIAISTGALIVSCASLAWNFFLERQRKRAKIQVWQRNNFYVGSSDDRTKINLIMRNLSHRPTAVIDIYVRDFKGGVIKNVGENDGVDLPIKVKPWDVQIVSFRIQPQEEKKISHILLRDIDDNKILITRGKGKTWHE